MADPQPTSTIPADLSLLLSLAQRADERDFVMEFVDRSDEAKGDLPDVWDEILDNYFVTPFQGAKGSGRSERQLYGNVAVTGLPFRGVTNRSGAVLKDPETHQIIEALTAQVLGLIFSGREYLQVTPVGADDPEKARLLQRLLTAVLEQPGNFRTFYQLFKDSFILGTSVVQIGWDSRSRQQLQPRAEFDDLGLLVGYGLSPQDVVYRDAPLIESVDLYDFYPDPQGTRIHRDMVGVAKRFRMTPTQAREFARAGIYDKEAVERAIKARPSRTTEGGKWRDVIGGAPRRDLPATVSGFEPLIGFEYWGRVPYKPSDGHTNRVITLLEGEIVRSHINPFIDGGVPFKEIVVNPVAGRFYGFSPAEAVRFIQDSVDHFLMAANDAADLMTKPALLVGRTFAGDTERLKQRRFNDMIPCADADAVKTVPNDLSALSIALQEYVRNKTTMREATGAANPLQALAAGDRQTAAEVSQIVRYASQRGELMAQLIEREDFPWIGRTLHQRMRQYLPESDLLVTLNGEPLRVPFEAVQMDADVRFVGTRQAQSKFQRIVSLREALNVLGTNPQVALAFPQLVERYLETLDIPDAAVMVQQAQQFLGLQMALAGAAKTGKSGGGGRPPASGTGEPRGETEGEMNRNAGQETQP